MTETNADEDFLRTFYQNLADRPLEPDHPWYVPIYAGPTASKADPVQRLARCMQWQPFESVQLFSGFRGTGKSTELRRLRQLLVGQGFKVVLCDMKHYLNLSTPVDISDFLISIAGALSEALAEDSDLAGEDVAKRGYWQRAVDLMTRTKVELEPLQVSASAGGLKVGLHQDPSFREQLQARMKGHLGALVDDVRAFMVDCVKAVARKHGDDTKLVVLFDSIEQIRGSSVNDAQVFESVQTLFEGHSDKLRFQGMHVIYTVPPWLKIRAPGIINRYDNAFLLPCIKLRERDGTACNAGVEVLAKIVGARGDWTKLFASRVDFDHVLAETGGYLRDLFRALQGLMMNAADRGSVPVDREAIDFELAELRNHYVPISLQDARWLAKVARSHEAELPQHDKIPNLSRYFDTHLLLCYRNGDEWYDLHPLIRDTVMRLASREPDEPNP